MKPKLHNRQNLIRKIKGEIENMPENEILVVLEAIVDLKKLRRNQNYTQRVAKLTVQARIRAAETRYLSHEELMSEFSETLKAIHENSNRISSAS